MSVVDASPLIYLGKTDLLYLLKSYRPVVIAPSVYQEVVEKGSERGFVDAERVEAAVNDFIEVKSCKRERAERMMQESQKHGYGLGNGEIESIALAAEREECLFSDDEDAKRFARSCGQETRGTIYLLVKACSTGVIERERGKNALHLMMEKGFWLSPDVVSLFYEKLDEL
jgi:predicted nucleic acid-binding protein